MRTKIKNATISQFLLSSKCIKLENKYSYKSTDAVVCESPQ